MHRSIVEYQYEILPGGAKRSNLSVPGLPINDNINVECILTPFIGHVQILLSGPAILRIQGKEQYRSYSFYNLFLIFTHACTGKLGIVQETQLVQLNSTVLQLSYTSPFTLVGVPINFYLITITSSDQATNVTINTTATEILYSPPNICTDYLLEIAAWNRVGKGESYFTNGTLYRG